MKAALALATLSLIAIVGCAGQDAKFVGHWQTSTSIDQAKGDQPGDRLLKGFADMAKAIGPQLDLRADHTFTLVILFTIEGKWTSEGNTVTCTPEKVSGMTLDKDNKSHDPFVLKLSDDGTSLTSTDGKQDWSLKRVTKQQ